MSNNMSQNSPNKSVGFVYFNTSSNPEPNRMDTSDFLAFNESPNNSPHNNRFRPNHYSSPQYRFPRNSPRNNYRGNKNNSGGNSWSHGTQYSPRSSYSSFSSTNSSFNNSRGEEDNFDRFIHSSFMEDPWAALEDKLDSQKSVNQCVAEMNTSDLTPNTTSTSSQ